MMSDDNGAWSRARIWFPVIAWIVSTLVAVTLAYAAIDTRLAVLETAAAGRESRLERIENKLDRLIATHLLKTP
ncbi:MAG TPA: hypothetical protein VMY35_11415 [Phycisphaerae bacterium]|nr:hypothetical protein [Phycisphaerae bacterium]